MIKKIDLEKIINNILFEQSVKPTSDYLGSNNAIQRNLRTQADSTNVLTRGYGFFIPFVFPFYKPAVEDTWYNRYIVGPIARTLAPGGPTIETKGKVKTGAFGHGGCIVVQPDGYCTLSEFGLYTSGDTRGYISKVNLGKIGKIKFHSNDNYELINHLQVMKAAKAKTKNDGPKLMATYTVLNLPKPKEAYQFASVTGPQKYTLFDTSEGGGMNCVTYVLEIAKVGGVIKSYPSIATLKPKFIPMAVMNLFTNITKKLYKA
jgi:hypothetical protein